jgi:hypothetical protein
MGITGFVLGVIGVLTFFSGLGFLFCILAIVFSSIGRTQTVKMRGMQTGLATAGLILGIVGLAVAFLIAIVMQMGGAWT